MLREWYNSTGKTAATETITQSGGGGGGGAAYDFAKRNTLADIEQHGLGQTDEVQRDDVAVCVRERQSPLVLTCASVLCVSRSSGCCHYCARHCAVHSKQQPYCLPILPSAA